MKGAKTSISFQALLLPILLLEISALVIGTATGTTAEHGPLEESPSSSGNELLPHLEGSDNSELDLVKRLYDFGLGKRAYSYVSEYKRLPVYNFGLGKRSKMYGFGLGKRGDADRLYSFGLGKRGNDDYYGDEDEEDQQSSGDEDVDDSDSIDLMDKRERLYSFGLGKRARPYSFGLGKRAPSSQSQKMYGFGLGKRGGPSNLYSFGLGKREGGRLYSFGLGKRPVNSGRLSGSRFNFGLGKRSDDFDLRELEDEKRSPQDHRFSFVLGKREVTSSELEAVKKEENEKQLKSKDEKKNSGERVKRSLHYPYSKYDLNAASAPEDNEDISPEEFSRILRRPFSFGLGKRIPMYEFGLGKRSEH